jgi:hypothetical protein
VINEEVNSNPCDENRTKIEDFIAIKSANLMNFDDMGRFTFVSLFARMGSIRLLAFKTNLGFGSV